MHQATRSKGHKQDRRVEFCKDQWTTGSFTRSHSIFVSHWQDASTQEAVGPVEVGFETLANCPYTNEQPHRITER
jgi:hypothetical protein